MVLQYIINVIKILKNLENLILLNTPFLPAAALLKPIFYDAVRKVYFGASESRKDGAAAGY